MAIAVPKVLIPEEKIKERVQELAHEISYDFKGKDITAICVLKGSYVFFADLIRSIDLPTNCEFMGVSSYGDKTTSSGEVKITLDLTDPLAGKHVIIVEDIIDSGLTIQYLVKNLKARNPASLKVCSLLYKPDSLKSDVQLDYFGFKLGQEFVVGYGLDYAGKFRNLPYVGILENAH